MEKTPIAKPSRNYGIDFLRIVSMLMVVALHISGTGGMTLTEMSFTNASIVWLSRAMTYCAVNCYALISGYIGITTKQKLSSLMGLWVRVAFYSFLITVIFFFARPDIVGRGDLFKSIFPVCSGKYWYFTAYFGMWFFTPIINSAVNNIPKKKMMLIIIGSAVILTPPNLLSNAFKLESGYASAWLLFLYMVGAFIKKYDIFKNISPLKPIIAYSISVLITFLLKITVSIDGWNFYGDMMLNYTSPTILISAVSLLVIFSNIKISAKLKKFIAFLAPLSFSVYLIHTHPLVFNNIFDGAFAFLAQKSPLIMVLGMIVATIAIYIGCSLIDYIRELTFRLFKVKKIISFAETKLLAFADKFISKLSS